MDFTKVIHAVQHNSISWFQDGSNLIKCLGDFHKKTGDSLLHIVCRYGRIDVLALKLSTDMAAYFELPNLEGKKPLHDAAHFKQLECVNILLENGVHVDCLKRGD